MKLAILTSVVMVCSAGIALAGANNMTSGRPSAVLNDTQCQAVWTLASPNGATDPPPLKWSDSKYGFRPEEDCDAEEETPSRRDCREAAPG